MQDLPGCQNTHNVSSFVIIKYDRSAIIEKKYTSIAINELNEGYMNDKINTGYNEDLNV